MGTEATGYWTEQRDTRGDLRFTNDDLRATGETRSRRLRSKFTCLLPVILGFLVLSAFCCYAEQRFPPPDFESGHKLPITAMPAARALGLQYLDLFVLVVCLAAASWLVYRKRSRRGLIGLSLFSLAYFGFYRKGCICAIGSLQNVALALCDRS